MKNKKKIVLNVISAVLFSCIIVMAIIEAFRLHISRDPYVMANSLLGIIALILYAILVLPVSCADVQDGRKHLGIENVRERLMLICGDSLDISSTPGEGTTAEIRIPKNRKTTGGEKHDLTLC